MSSLAPFFPDRRHVLLVAIHVETDLVFAIGDVEIARKAGADGVLLVNNSPSVGSSRLRATYDSIRARYPDWFLGINFLDRQPEAALQITPAGASALWFDNSKIDETQRDDGAVEYLRNLRANQLSTKSHLCFMPSVSMKYIGAKDDERVARLAAPFADILVTSGEKTRSAPDVEKIRRMAKAMPPTIPLGLASGVDIDNVEGFMQAGARLFIVNTKICKVKDRIDLELATALAEKIHA